ncbi:MAG: reverse transcriptase domain-containing protein [Candidatus Aenigmarchaeota archaeon]|nr:reverse transcriptase domain-containing protein [Candidatus Aenigmarchaeota archaeon]
MTRTENNLYREICSSGNIWLAFRKARKGKSSKYYVKEFETNIEHEMALLKEELKSETYHPKQLKRFVIHDPKTRVIHAPVFRDRIVHHAICNVIEPIFDNTFIYDSYASRKEKGMHAALKRFDHFKKKVSRNGTPVPYVKNNNMVRGWVLKADIRHYFPSVDHNILLDLLRKKISDEKTISQLQKIIKAYANESKGMPLGALTSQLFANVYLNPLDHFVKERLHAKYYLRYLDDFVILHSSRRQLEKMRDEIEKFLSTELKLELHPEKTSIFPLHNGVNFLGFRCFYHYRLLKKSNLRHFLLNLKNGHHNDKSIEGWIAHASWGNTYNLRKKIFQNF